MQTPLDASGNVPTPLTAFERKVATMTQDGTVQRGLEELQRKQALPLAEKIAISKELILDWYEAWDGMVSVSFSGGKDSTVLKHLVRSMYPDVPAVFCNTGLEYPEVVRLVQDTPNHVILKPVMSFSNVIKNYGWPIGSKKIARGVNIIRHPTENNANIRRLYLEGINRYGRAVQGFKVPLQWRFLFDAPFEVSDKCCDVMKKRPMAKYEKETGRRPFVGTMAADSKQRQRSYLLEGGCNAYDMKRPRSAPLSFWTEQDCLQYIAENRLPIAAVYGDVTQDKDGIYKTTGVRRTGCIFCCFGLHMDEGPYNRFELLALSHPKLHRYVMENLGLKKILSYCGAAAEVPRLAKSFRWDRPLPRAEKQLSLLGEAVA